MDEKAFVLQLRRFRWHILSAALAVFALVVLYAAAFIEHGKAQVGFRVQGVALVKSNESKFVYENLFAFTDQFEKQRMLIHSDEMIDHLVHAFRLYEHYNIDPNAPYAAERISRAVTNRLSVEKKVMDVIVVSYTDRDSRLAVDVLNEMMQTLEALNRRDVNAQLRTNAEIQEAARRELEVTLNNTQSQLRGDFERLNELYERPVTSDSKSQMLGLQLDIARQAAYIGELETNLGFAASKLEAAKASIESDKRPILQVLSKALPIEDTKTTIALGVGFAAAFSIVVLLTTLLYYRDQYEWILKTLFS